MTTVRDLVRSNRCTAACIAAPTTGTRCDCTCRGATHGLLGRADITALITARHTTHRKQQEKSS